MSQDYILALDAGTTSSRSILFDVQGSVVAMDQIEFKQQYPKKGWVEHDPYAIWDTQLKTIERVIQKAGIEIDDIISIGITNQRETTICWNKKTGKPIYNAIVWQCRRTASICDKIKQSKNDKKIFEKTGLVVDPYFSATKIKWIFENVPEAQTLADENNLAFGTVDSWLLYNLTGKKIHKTDITNASRTMIYNIVDKKWDNELLDFFSIPKNILPEVCDSNHIFGYTDKELIGKEIPISGILGDQQAALFGQNCFEKGNAKMTYGTGGFILCNTGFSPTFSQNKLLTTIGWQIDGKTTYAIEGSVFIAGAAIQWLRDNVKMIDNAAHSELYANDVEDSGGVIFIPAFTGLGAPYWDPEAKGAIFGITRDTTKAHIIRAAIEGIAFSTKDVVEAIQKDTETKITDLKVDGGASRNNFLLQFQSNILNCSITRPQVTETTALGAALMSGLGVKYYESMEEVKKNFYKDRTFTPEMDADLRELKYKEWLKAIKKIQVNFK